MHARETSTFLNLSNAVTENGTQWAEAGGSL